MGPCAPKMFWAPNWCQTNVCQMQGSACGPYLTQMYSAWEMGPSAPTNMSWTQLWCQTKLCHMQGSACGPGKQHCCYMSFFIYIYIYICIIEEVFKTWGCVPYCIKHTCTDGFWWVHAGSSKPCISVGLLAAPLYKQVVLMRTSYICGPPSNIYRDWWMQLKKETHI